MPRVSFLHPVGITRYMGYEPNTGFAQHSAKSDHLHAITIAKRRIARSVAFKKGNSDTSE